MMTMLIAAAVAAQPAPPADAHGQMTPEQHQQQMKDCCKDCCEHMADKRDGHGTERGGHGAHGAHAE